MERGAPARTILFVAVSAVLVSAALVLRNPPPSEHPSGLVRSPHEDGGLAVPARNMVARLNGRHAEVRVAARRFLTAFLRYEVGELGAPIRRALRGAATTGFANRLLSQPPRRPAAAAFPPRARLRTIDVAFVSPLATRVVVSGAALRGGLSEEFSFVFARRDGTWLASGPGE